MPIRYADDPSEVAVGQFIYGQKIEAVVSQKLEARTIVDSMMVSMEAQGVLKSSCIYSASESSSVETQMLGGASVDQNGPASSQNSRRMRRSASGTNQSVTTQGRRRRGDLN